MIMGENRFANIEKEAFATVEESKSQTRTRENENA